MSITEFLLARIAEDEAAATAANGPRWASGDGNVSEGGLYALQDEGEDGWAIAWFELGTANEAEDGSRQLPRWPKMERHAHENSVHAARHDPARVLRECEAKRRIVQMYELERARRDAYRSPRARTAEDANAAQDRRTQEARSRVAEDAALALAAVYSDHPDYDEDWRP